MTLALATLGELPDEGAEWDAAPVPVATPLSETESDPARAGERAGVHAQLRHALGGCHVIGRRNRASPRRVGGWIRTSEPRLLDAPLVAAMTDAWAPAAFVALGRFGYAPTLDLTIHIRRPLPPAGMAPEDFVLCRFTSRISVAGVWEEDGELWTPGGELIAQSRQLALIRELPS